MNKFKFTIASLFYLLANQSFADDVLTGRTKLSCEAILCLSTGSPPGECSPSLSEYFSINYDDFGDTIRGRLNFLNLCPVSSQTPEMKSLVNAIANGAGRCDAASLNQTTKEWVPVSNEIGFSNGYWCIKGNLPNYCQAYINHQYTDLSGAAKFIVDPPHVSIIQEGFGQSTKVVSKLTCGHWQ